MAVNLGQFLSANSPLPSGTVLEHLLALQFGAGQGETVFASKFCVVTGEDRLEVTNRVKRKAPAESARRPPKEAAPTDKRAYSFFTVPSVTAFTDSGDEVFVSEKQNAVLVAKEFDQITINRKKGQP